MKDNEEEGEKEVKSGNNDDNRKEKNKKMKILKTNRKEAEK